MSEIKRVTRGVLAMQNMLKDLIEFIRSKDGINDKTALAAQAYPFFRVITEIERIVREDNKYGLAGKE